MRTLATALLAVGLASPVEASPRSTLFEGDFAPTSERDAERFCGRYDRVTGDLRVGPEWPAEDLRLLGCVRGIRGSLVIDRAPALRSLAGLDGLGGDAVLGRVVVKGNPKLEAIGPGMPRSRDLVIAENPSLRSIAGIPAPVAGGRYVVAGNSQLRRIEGGAARSGTRLAAITVTDNPRLTQVSGFAGVHGIGTLSITRNERLVRIEGPPVRRAEAITIADAFVEALPVLSDLEVASSLTLHNLPRLEALPELPELTRIGRLFVDGCGALRSVDGLAANRRQRPVLDAAVVRANPRLPGDHAEQVLGTLTRGADPAGVVFLGNGPPAGDLDAGVPGGRR
jgi:hypothetical protein